MNVRRLRRNAVGSVLALVAALGLGGPGLAQGHAPAAGAAVARPAPTLALGSGAGQRVLSLAQLQGLPSVTYQVRHPQLRRTFTYRGVPLRALAELGGFGGQDLRLYASNGYLTRIRADEYTNAPIMLAYEADGHAITVLDKGPLTVVLPPEPRYQTSAYAGAWVWYVTRLAPAQTATP